MAVLAHHLIVAFLIVGIPLWDRYEIRRLKQSTNPHARIQSYQITLGWLWTATILLLLTTRMGDLFTPLPLPAPGLTLSAGVVIPVIVGLLVGTTVPLAIQRLKPGPPRPVKTLGEALLLFPRTRAERWWFAGVSVSAGICEEVIFRGFLIRYLAVLPIGLGLVGAVLGAALIFGVDHGYQGLLGVLVTGGLALLMTALFYASGALPLAMVVHALLDLRILLMILPTEAVRAAGDS